MLRSLRLRMLGLPLCPYIAIVVLGTLQSTQRRLAPDPEKFQSQIYACFALLHVLTVNVETHGIFNVALASR